MVNDVATAGKADDDWESFSFDFNEPLPPYEKIPGIIEDLLSRSFGRQIQYGVLVDALKCLSGFPPGDLLHSEQVPVYTFVHMDLQSMFVVKDTTTANMGALQFCN